MADMTSEVTADTLTPSSHASHDSLMDDKTLTHFLTPKWHMHTRIFKHVQKHRAFSLTHIVLDAHM